MDVLKAIAAAILGVMLVITLGWIATGNQLAMTGYFAPRMEAVRRNTFEQSKAYNQGMIQELQNMQFDYEQADEAHKAGLRTIILHRAADYPNLPPDLAEFVRRIK